MSPTRLSVSALSLSMLLGASGAALGVPIITNGSMTGPVASATVPPGWFLAQQTPDTCDGSGPFNNSDHLWALSPDGGTFVRAGGPSAGTAEAPGQVITSFDIGATYEISFYQSNLAHVHPTSGAYTNGTGQWEFYIDGGLVDASNPMDAPPTASDVNVWELDTITFTATASDHTLMIAANWLGGSTAAYMGIDGVRIREIPAPGAAGILGLAAATCARRRRRV